MLAIEYEVSTGLIIRSMELIKRSKPIDVMMQDTISPDMYSILACPNGCLASAGLPAILKPNRVIDDEPASLRLFIASAVIDMLDVRIPSRILTVNKNKFEIMPNIPANFPYAFLTDGRSVFS
jgi:hypothetical protein